VKPFPPALQEKDRYVAFKLHAKTVFTENQVKHSLNNTVFALLGENGMAKARYKILEYYPDSMSGVARANSQTVNNVVFALTVLKDIQGKNAWCQVLGTSGTIKTCLKKFGKQMKAKETKKFKKQKLSKTPKQIIKYSHK
jgi:RNase P/RNase MRP subunit POP5